MHYITGTRFRRISSEKYHSRSASTGDILTNFPPSYPESYNAMMHSATTRQTSTHSNSSSRDGGSFDHLMEGERVGFSALSMTGTASPDSVTLRGYDRQNSATRLKSYTHSHASGITRSRRDGSGGKRHSVQSPPSLPHSLPTQHALDPHSSRESSHSHLGRESGSYIRLTHRRSRDSMSQDTLGEREFDYRYRYDTNHSSTLPTLSLQNTHHREPSSSRRHSWGRERGILSDDRDLRRKLQEFDVMPIHEAFRHEAMESAPNETVPQYPPPPTNPGVGGVAVIDHQPLAATVESPENAQEGTNGNTQPLPHSYLPVFFSPESGLLYINVDGSYKLLPNQYSGNTTDGPNVHPEVSFNHVHT